MNLIYKLKMKSDLKEPIKENKSAKKESKNSRIKKEEKPEKN